MLLLVYLVLLFDHLQSENILDEHTFYSLAEMVWT